MRRSPWQVKEVSWFKCDVQGGGTEIITFELGPACGAGAYRVPYRPLFTARCLDHEYFGRVQVRSESLLVSRGDETYYVCTAAESRCHHRSKLPQRRQIMIHGCPSQRGAATKK